MNEFDKLNMDVSEAIRRAELALERLGKDSPETQKLYVQVSTLEEQISRHPEASVLERNIGRRGAINAALLAGQRERAKLLLKTFEDNPEFDAKSNLQMRRLIAFGYR